MRISKRLIDVSGFVDDTDKIIYDVGCDHALLDIFLANKYKNISFYALDISSKCIEKANENIIKYNLEDRIKTITNDGLKNIKIDKNSTLIITGMGAHTINNILESCDITKFKKIIIQSNNDLEYIRKKITSMNFFIENEISVFDKKYYVVISFIPGYKAYSSIELKYGPILLKNIVKNREYFQYLCDKYNEILKKIPFIKIRKKIAIFLEFRKIKKLLLK